LRARLIYNPTAGRELIRKNLAQILLQLEKAGYETSCMPTEGKWHAAEAAELAAKRKFDIVIAAGGDGTIHEVINGLAQVRRPPKLGVLPVGTSNDFARALKLPRDMFAACEVIARGKTKRVDVGKHNERYFVNVAAAGRLSEVTVEAASRLKTMVGSLAYYAKAIEQLGTLSKSFSVTLKTKEREWTEEVLLLIIANSMSVGGFEVAPFAQLSDGLFDVLLIHKCQIPDLVHIAALAMRGEHIHDPRVTYLQTRHLEVHTKQSLLLNLDGEWGGECNGSFELLPKHLKVFCP
jgi:diacylglycerol kinase (ATP)